MFILSIVSAAFVSYPFHYSREMVDIWPKERGGHCTWGNSYLNAIKWMYNNVDILFTNFFPNYWTYMMRKGIPSLLMIWSLDTQGFFTNSADNHLSLETMVPGAMESI